MIRAAAEDSQNPCKILTINLNDRNVLVKLKATVNLMLKLQNLQECSEQEMPSSEIAEFKCLLCNNHIPTAK